MIIRQNTLSWHIVQILADGHKRTGSDIRQQLWTRGVEYNPESIYTMVAKLCRRDVLDRSGPLEGNARLFWLKPGATFELGDGI